MRHFYLTLFTLLSLIARSQHSTMRFTDDPINLNQQSLLLVPFESRMYLSDINKELATENNLNAEEIVSRFISGIDQAIYNTFQKRCNISSFYALEDQDSKQDLRYIYSNLKLEYELLSKKADEKGLKKIKNKFSKKEEDDYQRGKIENGQIITKRDDRERYMKAVVENETMLDSMHFKFDNKFFLFITQLDLKNRYEDAISMQQMDYEREIKIHYTLYHKNGEILSTGLSRTTFPANLNDINAIISNYFPILAQQIYDELFPA